MDEHAFPAPNSLNAPFWRGADAGRLVLPTCVATGRPFWPPSPISPFVTSGAVVWTQAEPVGQLISVVVYRRAFQARFEPLMPYGIGLVALDAGPRLQAHLARPDDDAAVAPGARVRLAFARLLAHGPAVPTIVPSIS